VELIKNAGAKMEQKIYNIIRKIWNDEQMPMEWEEGIIYPIYKKEIGESVVITEE
jgi:hypothetical protein